MENDCRELGFRDLGATAGFAMPAPRLGDKSQARRQRRQNVGGCTAMKLRISSRPSSMASVHCMGPGLGAVGPSSNYAVLTDFQIWVCTLAMLLGRLEILSFMAMLSPAFWKR